MNGKFLIYNPVLFEEFLFWIKLHKVHLNIKDTKVNYFALRKKYK
jgi:hypothetical protein